MFNIFAIVINIKLCVTACTLKEACYTLCTFLIGIVLHYEILVWMYKNLLFFNFLSLIEHRMCRFDSLILVQLHYQFSSDMFVTSVSNS